MAEIIDLYLVSMSSAIGAAQSFLLAFKSISDQLCSLLSCVSWRAINEFRL